MTLEDSKEHLQELAQRRRRLQALYGKLGGLTASASGDARARTAKARAAFNASWLTKVDPEGRLHPAERLRRAEAAKKLHYVRMVIAREEKRLGHLQAKSSRSEMDERLKDTQQVTDEPAAEPVTA